MICPHYEEIISLCYDETPSVSFTSHLEGCPSCQGLLQEFKAVRQQLQSLPSREVSAYRLQNIKMLARQQARKLGWHEVVLGWFQSFQWKSLAPAGVMVMMVVALMNVWGRKPTSPVAGSFPNFNIVDQDKQYAFSPAGFNPTLGLGNEVRPHLFDVNEPVQPTPVANVPFEKWEQDNQAMMESSADSLMMRGRRFKAMGRVDLALNDFETILHFYPQYTYLGDVLMYSAQCYALQGHTDKALEMFKTYVEKYPDKKEVVDQIIQQIQDK